MAGVSLEVERGFWRVAGHNLAIDYSMPVLELIRDAAIEGFNKLPHGGIEIGGVLFGVRDGDRVCVLDSQPLECEYALGPSFSLSEKDQTELVQLLETARSDPKLDGLVPVGWYHAHTRSEICLTDRDLSLYNRFSVNPKAASALTRVIWNSRSPQRMVHAPRRSRERRFRWLPRGSRRLRRRLLHLLQGKRVPGSDMQSPRCAVFC